MLQYQILRKHLNEKSLKIIYFANFEAPAKCSIKFGVEITKKDNKSGV